MATPRTWQCPKCESTSKELGEFRAHGGFWSSFFDVSTRRFRTVTCRRCGYTEFYKAELAAASKVLDFLGGG
jgi:uncharacterized protein